MGLREYHRKRDFAITPEPRGEEARTEGRSFCVQKHAATRLHYDFRLEMEGVLKSWAVPKGPSYDPADKRLAMHTEDHPLDYGDFEGIIPEGQYGGGTVLLWDRGTWTPLEDPHKGYRAGKLKFRLDGEKLKGGWTLVKIRGRDARDDEKSWLLIKETDETTRPAAKFSITEERPESVATGRDLETIAKDHDAVWESKVVESPKRAGRWRPKLAATPKAPPAGKQAAAVKSVATSKAVKAADVRGARKGPLPRALRPQLATLVTEAPAGDGWLHELKFDGYRILARVQDGRARLISRNGNDWTGNFPSLTAALESLPVSQALIDGEVAVVLPDGTTSFQALQNALSQRDQGELVYFAFDLPHLDGYDLTRARLEDRKAALQPLLTGAGSALRYSAHVVGSGQEFFDNACRLSLEGIVSKRRDAPYEAGRGGSWLKVKCLRRQEVVIGGFTEPSGSRTGLGALLVGVHEAGGGLRYVGKVGTGYTEKVLRDLRRRLEALEEAKSPFSPPPKGVGAAHWVKPELVAEVAFTEWTGDGKMRHPSFQGLRTDKPAREVVREQATPTEEVVAPAEAPRPRRSNEPPPNSTTRSSARTPARGKGKVEAEATVAGVRLTHPDRVLYPAQGLTKRGLAAFYESIADWILPHVVGRPLTLVRCPEGLEKDCFFMKHSGVWAPPALRRVKIREKTKVGEYLVVDDLAGIISLVQMGILEIHTWNSLADKVEEPNRIVFDLDPGPAVPFDRVMAGARLVREALRSVGLESFVKTTGGKGLHVVVPLAPGHGWDETFGFSQLVASQIVREDPRTYTDSMPKAGRKDKILVDVLRNNRGSTSVAAYSTRARPGAPVSVPLAWEELQRGLKPDQYTVENLPRRLSSLKADPWARYFKLRQKIAAPGGRRRPAASR
jgi:bifunctional non-homologous end joining protein LigD